MDAFFLPTGPCILRETLQGSFMSVGADANRSHDLLSKADFLHAVATVTEGSGTPAGSGGEDMEAVFVTCPYDTWKQAFGEPRDFREYRGIVSDPPVEVWEQPCSDGMVRCVGYLVNDPHHGPWVIVTRVCLF
jgi:hypothetical protein